MWPCREGLIMTSHQKKLEYMETSLKVPSEGWQTSDNGCDDDDAMIQKKDLENTSCALDDSSAYDPDFETWDEVDLSKEMTLDNSFASHQTDDLGENHSHSCRSLPHNEAHSPPSTAGSRISFRSSHNSVMQPDPQALHYELSSNSSTQMQSSRGDSWATVTPISCSSTPMKAISSSNRYPSTDVKQPETSPKRRDPRLTHERISYQNLNFESQNEKTLHGSNRNQRCINNQNSSSSQKKKLKSSPEKSKKAGVYDWDTCSDREFIKEEDQSDSDMDSLDQRFNTRLHVPIKTSDRAKSEPRSKFCRTFDHSKVSCGDSKDLFDKCHNGLPDNDRADEMDPSTQFSLTKISQISSDLSSVTGLERGDVVDKGTVDYCIQRQKDDNLRWMNSTGRMMEDVAKHSTFDLALVLSQPPLSVLTPPFKLEDLENYTQVSQSMLKEKIIRLAALLQACRDLIAWNKEERQQLLAERETLRSENAEFARNLEARNQEILNKTQEIKNLKAENEVLQQAVEEGNREKAANKDEFKRQADKLEKDRAKSEEDFVRLLGVAKGLKMELRNVRHELVRKGEEKRRALMQKDEDAREELMQREEEMRQELVQKVDEVRNEAEEEMREELARKEEQIRRELMLKDEEMREEIREEMREEIGGLIMQKEEEMRQEISQIVEEEFLKKMMLKENLLMRELIKKEDAFKQEIVQKEEEIEALQTMLEKEKQRHLAEEESAQKELDEYKDSIKVKLDEAEQKVSQRMEQLQLECQRYMQSIRMKGRHLRPTTTRAVEQKTDLPSIAEKAGSTTPPRPLLTGRSSAVPASPLTQIPCYQELTSPKKAGTTTPPRPLLTGRSSAVPTSPLTQIPCYQELTSRVNDCDPVLNQPRKSPMFSCAKIPTAKVHLASPASSSGTLIASRVQQLLDSF